MCVCVYVGGALVMEKLAGWKPKQNNLNVNYEFSKSLLEVAKWLCSRACRSGDPA